MVMEIRQLDGLELLQLVGFSLQSIKGSFPDHKTATSMAGNAFSGFAVGPVLLGAFAGMSRADPISSQEADASDSDSSRAVCDVEE